MARTSALVRCSGTPVDAGNAGGGQGTCGPIAASPGLPDACAARFGGGSPGGLHKQHVRPCTYAYRTIHGNRDSDFGGWGISLDNGQHHDFELVLWKASAGCCTPSGKVCGSMATSSAIVVLVSIVGLVCWARISPN